MKALPAKQSPKKASAKTKEPCRCAAWHSDWAILQGYLEPWGDDGRYLRCRYCGACYTSVKPKRKRPKLVPPMPAQVELFDVPIERSKEAKPRRKKTA